MKTETIKQYRETIIAQGQALAQQIQNQEAQLAQSRANYNATQGALQALDKLIQEGEAEDAAGHAAPPDADQKKATPSAN